MTVSSSTRKAGPFAGNASATVFPFAFKIFTKADVKVLLVNSAGASTPLTLDSDYSVTLNPNQNTSPGGWVTYPINGAPLPVGYQLVMLGDLPYDQETDITNGGGFYPNVIEDMSDRSTIQIQQLAEVTSRALVITEAESASPVLPNAAARANSVLGFDAMGNVEVMSLPPSVGAGDLKNESWTAGTDFTAGTSTSVLLSRAYGNKANLGTVVMQGFAQDPASYSLVGSTLQFDSAIPASVTRIWCVGGTTLSVFLPPVGSVGDAQLVWGAILGRVCSTRAELKALDTTIYQRAFVVGYAAAGDGGGLGAVVFNSASALADNGGSITAPNHGSGRWLMPDVSELDVRQFGAVGDNVTDDTAAIQACYNAVRVGGLMHIPAAPAGAYLISKLGTNNYCLNFSRPVNIRADGFFAALRPANGTTVNTVLLKPDPAFVYDGMEWDGLALTNPADGTRAGNNGIFVDTTVVGSQLAKPIFRRLIVGVGTGAAFLHINTPTGINVNGGMYAAVIDECRALMGGVNLQATGDSNTIKRCVMSGPGIGVYASLTAGASLLTIEDCNITCTNGAIKIDAGSRTKVLRCNMEQTVPFTNGGLYMVDFSGAGGTMAMCELRGCHLGLFSGVSNAGNVHISNCIGFLAEGNVLLNSNAAAVAFVIDNSTDTKIGDNVYGTSVVTRVADSGAGTMGVLKNPTLVNNWANASGNAAAFMKSIEGIVALSGTVTAGTANSGVTTLPAGFRPSQVQRFSVYSSNGGSQVMASIQIDTGGNILQMSGAQVQLSLDGISFPAAALSSSTADL